MPTFMPPGSDGFFDLLRSKQSELASVVEAKDAAEVEQRQLAVEKDEAESILDAFLDDPSSSRGDVAVALAEFKAVAQQLGSATAVYQRLSPTVENLGQEIATLKARVKAGQS